MQTSTSVGRRFWDTDREAFRLVHGNPAASRRLCAAGVTRPAPVTLCTGGDSRD